MTIKYSIMSAVLFWSSITISQPVPAVAWRCYAGAFLMMVATFLMAQAVHSINEGDN